ncbi:fumarylacetoacetate hydrolase family protein [Streptomyces sp. Inha503]|uniref:fumarylacetoacetate hydrolase family protein n=1 Tax=Streptomyces sp. Inha503 TaxID=3383314 RepID=UPI0039A19959
MRIANLNGRAHLLSGPGAIDIAWAATGGSVPTRWISSPTGTPSVPGPAPMVSARPGVSTRGLGRAGSPSGPDLRRRAELRRTRGGDRSGGSQGDAVGGPTGPALVSLDEITPDTPRRLRCWVNDELVQDGSTEQMIMPVPVLIERISSVCTLYPGDLVFTGTPAGVGMGRTPARYLASGDEIRTSIDGIGEMTHVLR